MGHRLSEKEILEVFQVAEELRAGKLPVMNVGRMKNNVKDFFGMESKFVSSDELLSELGIGRGMSALKHKAGLSSAKQVTAKQLETAWDDIGRPTDSDKVIALLKRKFKFSDNDIRKIFSEAAKRAPHAKDLASEIKKSGLVDQMLKYIDELEEEGLAESARPSEITEKLLADRDIKDLFYQMASAETQNNKDSSATQNTNEYIKKWATSIKNTQDMRTKIALIKEIVGYLKDRYKTPEWGNVAKFVQKTIQSSEVDKGFAAKAVASISDGKPMERKLFSILNAIVLESNLRWSDLQVVPVLKEGGIVLKPVLFQRKVLLEDFFEAVIIQDRVNVVKQGRRRK